MTITAPDVISVAIGTGDPITKLIPGFFYKEADVRVYLVSVIDGLTTEVLLVQGVDYTLTKTPIPAQFPVAYTGSVLTVNAVAANQKVAVIVWPANEQPTDFSAIPYEPAQYERQLDQAAMRDQVLTESIKRTIRLPFTFTGAPPLLGDPVDGFAIIWRDGNLVAEINAADIAQAQENAAVATAQAIAAAQSAAIAAAAEASLLKNDGPWQTLTDYVVGSIVQQNGTSYHCEIPHTSGVFGDDFAAGRWTVFAAMGAPGPGTGDMIGTNNLSDVENAAAAFAQIKQNASTGVTGVVRRATPAEGAAGTEDQAVPAVDVVKEMIDTHAPVSPIKAWVTFNGTGVVSILDSFNVDSITDNGTGDYTINFTNDIETANYCVSGTAQTVTHPTIVSISEITAPTVSALRINTENHSSALVDNPRICVSVIH